MASQAPKAAAVAQNVGGEDRGARVKLRNLLDDAKQKQEEMANPKSAALEDILIAEKTVFDSGGKGVKGGTHSNSVTVLDAQLLNTVSDLGVRRGKKLQTYYEHYREDEALQKLAAKMKAGSDDIVLQDAIAWNRPELTTFLLSQYKPAQTMTCMLGPLYVERKEKRKGAPRKRAEVVEAVQPKENRAVDETQANTTFNKSVQDVRGALPVNGSTDDLFRTLINPSSFGQTVENIFAFSFLVKDGLAEVKMTDGIPMCTSRQPVGDISRLEKKQAVMSLDYKAWQELCGSCEVAAPVVPDRSHQYEELTQKRQRGRNPQALTQRLTQAAARPGPVQQVPAVRADTVLEVDDEEEQPRRSGRTIKKRHVLMEEE